MIRAGDTFAVPTGDGRFGAIRVLRLSQGDRERTALVAVTPWLGPDVPDLNEPLLRQILKRNRGRFGGRPALCWYAGQPPREFIHIGVIPPAESELQIDPQGEYGGPWHTGMARDAVLELGGPLAPLPPAKAVREDVDRISGVMPDAGFWHVISLLNWDAEGDDDAVLEPAMSYLAQQTPEAIAGFYRKLSEKLHELDGEKYAREMGEHSYGSSAGFSPDEFLYARAAVVANGKTFYESVLAHPRKMPKDREFEALLSLAESAYAKKTGRTPLFLGAKAYETFSNKKAWLPEATTRDEG